ncbi:hypothetical protein AOQ84DRAFT_281733 [Glonium stellatum]|uniref:Uncharacterized protein n=1 Tax=Glonium stellatum TaxID=574774 RepID=A0A8E2FBG8_9PEZI|nr:hypothetical protein AOQ84DRAFT_281733 [Glonium stellatum]
MLAKSVQTTTTKVEDYTYSGNSWLPGFWRRLPWSGLLSLIGVILCATTAAVVLKLSNGKTIDDWPYPRWTIQPTVLLAILSAVANALLRYALGEGLTIAWWVKALKGGTVGDLHRYWDYGSSLKASTMSGRHFNSVALATLIASVVVIDGPLLQRASSVANVVVTRQARLYISISPDPLPIGFTSAHTGHGGTIRLNPEFSEQVMQGYNNRTAIPLSSTGCSGTCLVTLEAAGFDFDCSRGYSPYNITMAGGMSANIGYTNISFGAQAYSQLITVATAYKGDSGMHDDLSCTGNLILQNCTLRQAKVKYPVQVVNGTVSLLPSTDTQNETIEIWPSSEEVYGLGTWPSTLGGISVVASNRFQSTTSLYYDGTPFTIFSTGIIPLEHLVPDNTTFGTCNMTWTDPMPEILTGIREIMFRTAIAATNATTRQTFPATETVTLAIYVSHYGYLTAAFTVMVLSVSLVFPIFIGWWQLGRKVTLSPIEVASAFEAPLFIKSQASGEVKMLLKGFGDTDIKYGEVIMSLGDEQENRRLAMERSELVKRPTLGVIYVG